MRGCLYRTTDDEENGPTLANCDFLDYLEDKYRPQFLRVDLSRTRCDEWGGERLQKTIDYLRELGYAVRLARIATPPRREQPWHSKPKRKSSALRGVARIVDDGAIIVKRLEPLIFRLGLLAVLTLDIGQLSVFGRGCIPNLLAWWQLERN